MPPGICTIVVPKFPTISLSEEDLKRNFAVRSWVHNIILQIFAGKKCFVVVVVNPRDWHRYVIAIVILLHLKKENCSIYSYRCVFWNAIQRLLRIRQRPLFGFQTVEQDQDPDRQSPKTSKTHHHTFGSISKTL